MPNTTLPKELFERYCANPALHDQEVRKFAHVQEREYYTVSVWPESQAGVVRLNGQARVLKTPKVSKSDQPPA